MYIPWLDWIKISEDKLSPLAGWLSYIYIFFVVMKTKTLLNMEDYCRMFDLKKKKNYYELL